MNKARTIIVIRQMEQECKLCKLSLVNLLDFDDLELKEFYNFLVIETFRKLY